MIQEKKELLFKELCARLPYGVKAHVKSWSKIDRKYYEDTYTVKSTFPSLNEIHVQSENGSVDVLLGYSDYEIKPYLFPMSSMTKKQKKEYNNLCETILDDLGYPASFDTVDSLDYLYKNHIDIRGLIPMGLAIDATGLNIY